MKHLFILIIALLLGSLGLLPNSSAEEPKTSSAWPFTTENGLFHLWLPQDASAIKGLLVFPLYGAGEPWSVSPEVQELAKELNCGIVMAFIRTTFHIRVRDEKFQWSWETPVVVGQSLEIASSAEFAGDKSEAHCILTTPDNKFVYVPYVKGNNAIYQYRFDAESGQMTALEPKNANPPEGTGPRHMSYHPTKPVVYFSNEQHLGVSAYDIAAS